MSILEVKGNSQPRLKTLTIATPPTKTIYEVGERFDPTGMVLTATYSDNTTASISSFDYDEMLYPPFREGDTKAIVSIFENDSRATVEQNISLRACFNDYTWAEIHDIAVAGQASAKGWQVGDKKTVHLQGRVMNTMYNADYQVEIAKITSNSIFLIGFCNMDGVPVALTSYPFWLDGQEFKYGWKQSYMRDYITNGYPGTTRSNGIALAMPRELRNVLRSTMIQQYNQTSLTTDYTALYVPSKADIMASSPTHFPYFDLENSRIRYDDSNPTTPVAYWLRDCTATQTYIQTGAGDPSLQSPYSYLGVVCMMEVGNQ